MSESLIFSVTSSLDAETIIRVADDTGASEEKVVDGFRTVVSAILGEIVKMAHDSHRLRQVFQLVTNASSASLSSAASELNRNASSRDPGAPPAEQGQHLLSTIFGRDRSAVVQEISRQADLPSDVVVEIMAKAAPIVLSLLGRRVKDQGISFSAFPNLLFREAGNISSYLPAADHNLLRSTTPTVESSRVGAAAAPEKPSGTAERALVACLIGGMLVGIGWFIRQSHTDAAQVERAEVVSRSRAALPGLGAFVDRELPGKVRLYIPENGMEAKLISYIQDSSRNAGTEQWFDFDRLTFDKNSAIPRAESEEQLANLASILKAYPQVRIKVGGYTDSRGNREANQRLSENRAESVRRELAGMGIGSSRVEAEGYGDQHAIADNATEQGRAKNRRIAVKILQN